MDTGLGPIAQIDAGELNVGYADLGPTDGPAVLLLHGWPYDIHSFDEVAPMLAEAGHRVIVPHLRGYGTTTFRWPDSRRNGQQAVFALDAAALLDALQIPSAVVGGFDWGARTANIVAALWPTRFPGQVTASGYLIGSQKANVSPLPPAAELAWWYQFYFATERGRVGYEQYRDDFARLIWHTASPRWAFSDETFDRSADSLANADHVEIVIHNYRWRLGVADGDPQFDELEERLAARPPVTVPAITMEGDANGAPHPEAVAYRDQFTGWYEHRVVGGGVGHNLPQEAPRDFADAVIDVARVVQESGPRSGRPDSEVTGVR
jgi:pimeloyl-ACP methyl ester carboxylesterase